MIGSVRAENGVSHYDTYFPNDLAAMLEETVARLPEKTAYIDRGRTITWRQFGEEVSLLAGRLAETGVKNGDQVALLAGNGIPFSVAVFAVWRIGAVLVPLNHRLLTADISNLLVDSGATLVLVGDEHKALGEAAAKDANVRLEFSDTEGNFLTGSPSAPLPENTPGSEAYAAIMYTSGTTGKPKGVVISHRNALENNVTCIEVLGRTERDSELIMVPQFNITGLCSQTLPAAQLGMTSVLFGPFDAKRALVAIEEFGATSTVGAPTMWWRLIEAAESTGSSALLGLRLAFFGGAPMPTALLARMRQAMPSATFGNGYGQTETCSMVTFVGGQEAILRPDSVGKPLPITDLRIVDVETRLPALPGEAGEIEVRGGQIALGYWQAGEVHRFADDDGWVRTGDGAVVDRGFVVLRDRIKDVIKRGGESVFSFEVEDCLVQHPDIMEAAVVGIPDEQLGEIVAAAVVTKPGHQIDKAGLSEYCAAKLAHFKIPKLFEVIDELPRNAGGKVLKNELRDLFSHTRNISV